MSPSVDPLRVQPVASPNMKNDLKNANDINNSGDHILQLSSLSVAISSLETTNSKSRVAEHSLESDHLANNNTFVSTSLNNKVKGESSSSSSLSSTVGSSTMWGSPQPNYGPVSNTSSRGNYFPSSDNYSHQSKRDDLYPPTSTTNQDVNNNWRNGSELYHPVHIQSSSQGINEPKKGMGSTLLNPSTSHSSLFNSHNSLNDIHAHNSHQYAGNNNKPIGSIGSNIDSVSKKSSTIGNNSSVAASPSVSSVRSSNTPSYQDRKSQQLFHLTGNMNAVIPHDNINDNSVDSGNNSSRGNGNWHNVNNNMEPILHPNHNHHQENGFEMGKGPMDNERNRLLEGSVGPLHYSNNGNSNQYRPVDNANNFYPPYVPGMVNGGVGNVMSQQQPHPQTQPQPQQHYSPYPVNSTNAPYCDSVRMGRPNFSKNQAMGGLPPDSNQYVPGQNTYSEQQPPDSFPHNMNSNPQQQIFYMAVPMQNGVGQMLQPVQMVQLPNGQSTFVVPAHPQPPPPLFPPKDKENSAMGSVSGVKSNSHYGHDRDSDAKSHYLAHNASKAVLSPNPSMYNPVSQLSGGNTSKKKEKRNKSNKSGNSSNNSKHQDNSFSSGTMGQYSGDLTTTQKNDHSYTRYCLEDHQLNNHSSHNSLGNKSSSDAITALYHSPQRPPLSSLLGHVRRLSRDQVGCRLLQQSLDEDGPYAATAILKEGLPFLTEAMTDPFGNYLFQKILEKVTPEEKLVLISTVGPRLVNAALNLHGTRSVQKVVEMSVGDSKCAEIVTQFLAPAAARLCIDSHGNHVIQRILQKLPHIHSKFVFDAVANSVGDVARHRHGCCVIQRCLDSPPSPARSNLVKRIVEKSLDLMQDAYGNYVVQYVLDVCGDDEAAAVCESVVGKIGLLAIQKFSSNVMEKCLERSSDRVQELHLLELSAPDKIRELMADPFGNYVVQKALSVATHAQAVRLVEAMRPHLPGMRNTAGGRRIVAKIVRRFPRFNPNFGVEDIVNGPADQQRYPMHPHHVNYTHPPPSATGMGYNIISDHGFSLGMMNNGPPPLLGGGGHSNDYHQNGLMNSVETYSVDNVRLRNNSGHA